VRTTFVGWQVGLDILITAPKSQKRRMMFVVARRAAFKVCCGFWLLPRATAGMCRSNVSVCRFDCLSQWCSLQHRSIIFCLLITLCHQTFSRSRHKKWTTVVVGLS